MANPVNNQRPFAQAQQEAPVMQNRPPAGVGAAPSVLQGQQAPAEKGYVETLVLTIKHWIVGLYEKICSWFKKAPPPAAVDFNKRHREVLAHLNEYARGEDMWEYFEEYFSNQPMQRKIIFTEIGKRFGSGCSWQPWEVQGHILAVENPHYLLPALKARVQTRINQQ